MNLRLGAYVLTGDPEWLRSSLQRYYDVLDELVVLVPEDGIGWAGRPVPVADCLEAVADVDRRGIARIVSGRWVDRQRPIDADTAQRQFGLQQLSSCDWVIQIDNDEILPDVSALAQVIADASPSVVGIEWPMRVLFRRLDGLRFLAISDRSGGPVFEYPGPVAVRPTVQLVDARRTSPESGNVIRCVIPHDETSLQLRRPAAAHEIRRELASAEHAILHNSWGRSPGSVWNKIRTWGHAQGAKSVLFYVATWLPAPLLWRHRTDLHPFAEGLWPGLAPLEVKPSQLHPADRRTRGGRGATASRK